MAEESRQRSVLWDRYERPKGRAHLTGLQAVVRLLLDQVRNDERAGRVVAALLSGGLGRPMDRLVRELEGLAPLLDAGRVRYVASPDPAFAAGAIAGSQALDLFPLPRVDGVLGAWFGSGSDLEAALGVVRRANHQGLSRYGGAIAIVADDPLGDFGDLATSSEWALAHASVPVFVPADPGEILSLGRHAFEASRFAGTWVALRLSSDVVAGGSIETLDRSGSEPQLPKLELGGRLFQKRLEPSRHRAALRRAERELVYERMQAVTRYAELNGLNPIEHRHARDTLGIVAAGSLYRELTSALGVLGLEAKLLGQLGIRILRLQLIYPCPRDRIREFADGVGQLIVVDERRGFLEQQVRSALDGLRDAPRVLGQLDARGAPWLSRHERITAGTLALDLAGFLAREARTVESCEAVRTCLIDLEHASRDRVERVIRTLSRRDPETRVRRLDEVAELLAREDFGPLPAQTPGAHIASTPEAPEAELEDWEKLSIPGDLSEAGPGSAWIGLAPFLRVSRRVVELDPKLDWERCLRSVRRAVEAESDLIFVVREAKLRSGATCVHTSWHPSPVERVRDLLRTRVERVAGVSADLTLLSLAERDPRVEVLLPGAEAELWRRLLQHSGVSIWIDDPGAERRTARPGVPTWAIPPKGVESDWAQLFEFDGEWIESSARGELSKVQLCDPSDGGVREQMRAERGVHVLVAGVQARVLLGLLVRAAEIQGLFARDVETPERRDAGTPLSAHCVLARSPICGSPRGVGMDGVDLLLALDDQLWPEVFDRSLLSSSSTRAILHASSDATAWTNAPLVSGGSRRVTPEEIRQAWSSRVRETSSASAEALARSVLGDGALAPLILLGMALQQGCLPFSVASLECAIRDLATDVESDLLALRLGRCVVASPVRVEAWLAEGSKVPVAGSASLSDLERPLGASWKQLRATCQQFEDGRALDSLLERIEQVTLDLADYQSPRYAESFVALIDRWLRAELNSGVKLRPNLAQRVVGVLYRCMAYRDGYESARVRLRGRYRRWLTARTRHLHLRHVFRLGHGGQLNWSCSSGWADAVLRLLHLARILRGTVLDPMQLLGAPSCRRRARDFTRQCVERLAAGLKLDRVSEARRMLSGLERMLRSSEEGEATCAEFSALQQQIEKDLEAALAPPRS